MNLSNLFKLNDNTHIKQLLTFFILINAIKRLLTFFTFLNTNDFYC